MDFDRLMDSSLLTGSKRAELRDFLTVARGVALDLLLDDLL